MTEQAIPVLHRGFIAMESMPPGIDLVADVRALNDAGVQVPWVWQLAVAWPEKPADEEQEVLIFGIHNDTGILSWECGMKAYVPVSGTGSEWTSACLAGLHESPVRPKATVPVDTVFEAVAEYLRTRSQPTCVQWERAEVMPGYL